MSWIFSHKSFSERVRGLATAIFLSSALPAVGAGPIVDTSGFESFNLASLAGQQQWVETPGAGGAANVQTSVINSGSKAVKVDHAANADKRWAVEVTGFPSGRFVLIDWDMRVTGTGVTSGAFGPFFGVEAYDSTPVIGLIGSLGVDATTGELLYQQQSDGSLVASSADVAFDSWHHYRMLLDFNLKKYSAYLDGVRLLTEGFVDQNRVAGGLTNFTDADISTFAAFGDPASLALTGTAYYDNFRVWNGIPGDFVVDGAVNGTDFTQWKTAFGFSSAADADGDLDSDGADFLAWQREGITNLLASTAASAAVPEPVGAVLVVLAALGARFVCRAAPNRGGGR